jgi:FKBP-type peptidyl-prolyl cis-trans isomerase
MKKLLLILVKSFFITIHLYSQNVDSTININDFVKAKYPNAKKTASGLYYVFEKEGSGEEARMGEKAAVHYIGTLTNGKQFDSSYDRNTPISFTLGTSKSSILL